MVQHNASVAAVLRVTIYSRVRLCNSADIAWLRNDIWKPRPLPVLSVTMATNRKLPENNEFARLRDNYSITIVCNAYGRSEWRTRCETLPPTRCVRTVCGESSRQVVATEAAQQRWWLVTPITQFNEIKRAVTERCNPSQPATLVFWNRVRYKAVEFTSAVTALPCVLYVQVIEDYLNHMTFRCADSPRTKMSVWIMRWPITTLYSSRCRHAQGANVWNRMYNVCLQFVISYKSDCLKHVIISYAQVYWYIPASNSVTVYL